MLVPECKNASCSCWKPSLRTWTGFLLGTVSREPKDSSAEKHPRAAMIMRVFDPYALALSFLVGGVGFGMTFFFNTNVYSWRMQEIGYPAMAMVSSLLGTHTSILQ